MHDTNDAFLRTLLAMAARPRLGSVMRNMSTVVPGNSSSWYPAAMTSSSAAREIVDAIDAGDANGAADVCVTLLTDQGDLVIKLLASRGMFAADS